MLCKGDEDALGAAGHGTADMKFRAESRAAGENEGPERFENLVHRIHFLFEPFRLDGRDAGLRRVDVFGEGGEDGAEIEEFVLDAEEDRGQVVEAGFGCGEPGETGEAVELVDGAVGFDAEVVFADTLATDKAGFAGVAAPGVDTVEGQARLVKLFTHSTTSVSGVGPAFCGARSIPRW